MLGDLKIREFEARDRTAVRSIACRTAFLAMDQTQIFDNMEVLADALTVYFTDYEPQSCFVAESNGRVFGYLIGAVSAARMAKVVEKRILPSILGKLWRDRTFFRKPNASFLLELIKSFFKGEFFMPVFFREYPATLHINLEEGARGQRAGAGLIKAYFAYLKNHGIKGVHLATYSENAKGFFEKMGFRTLYTGRRSYLKHYAGRDIFVYILGATL